MKNKIKKLLMFFAALPVCGRLALNIYAQDYYKAVDTTLDIYRNDFMHYSEEFGEPKYAEGDDYIAYVRSENKPLLILYPGGKVDHKAYIPLATLLADRGIDTLIAEMPFNLAVFDKDAAEKHRAMFDNTEHFYIGGHSLGGAMAARYLAGEDSEKYHGLILLGSYSASDLTECKNVDKALSVVATNDKVMNWDKYKENYKNLPENTTEVVIDGGCHSYFGCYGMQEGDGVPTISFEEQTEQVADAIADFIMADLQR